MGAFLLGLVGVGWRDRRTLRIRTIAEVAQGLEIPVVGTRSSQTALPRNLPWYEASNDRVDAVRVLLTSPSLGTRQVVLVTSAVGQEGATSLAAQLAASLARSGRRTLLIDGNLRRPALHPLFGLPPGPGLSEILRGEAVLNRVVRSAPLDRLWLLPAGLGDSQAVVGLSREGGLSFLDQVRKDYDLVLIDSAPVLPVSDAQALSLRVDAVLLAVQARVSRFPTVYAAWQRLATLGVPLLGVVLQDAPDDAAGLAKARRKG